MTRFVFEGGYVVAEVGDGGAVTDYTRFAQDTFGREKALIEKLGLAKAL